MELAEGIIEDSNADLIGTLVEGVDVMTGDTGGEGQGAGMEIAQGDLEGTHIEYNDEPKETGRKHEGRKKRPGLMISFEKAPDRQNLGRLVDDAVLINETHLAYEKAKGTAAENYHIFLAVAWVLSNYLEGEKSPQMFISRFLSNWGNQ